jgi:hypothetical protein
MFGLLEEDVYAQKLASDNEVKDSACAASNTGENFLCRWGLKACETTTHQALTKQVIMI